jgi:hypothetical protein
VHFLWISKIVFTFSADSRSSGLLVSFPLRIGEVSHMGKQHIEKGDRKIIIVDSIHVKHMIAILITLNRRPF